MVKEKDLIGDLTEELSSGKRSEGKINDKRGEANNRQGEGEANNQHSEANDKRNEACDKRKEVCDKFNEAGDELVEVNAKRSETNAKRSETSDKRSEQLIAELRALAAAGGADLFGIADLTAASTVIEAGCGLRFCKFNRAVALAVCFPREVIQELLEGPTHTYLHYYRVVNARLDDLALRISNYLQVRGFKTFPIPSSQRVSRDRLAGIFPHRLAAQLAGLGWIGKSGSLITREFGPRIRLVTVLTDAPLCPNQPVDSAAKNCGKCQLCIESCPAQALKGVGGVSPIGSAASFDPQLCDEYQNRVRSQFGKRVCGVCLAVCPFGK